MRTLSFTSTPVVEYPLSVSNKPIDTFALNLENADSLVSGFACHVSSFVHTPSLISSFAQSTR